ncbi:hypothetical protein ACFUJR_36245 [Streptomyces sp. NPDC057271]|uniref:hypothetical protein n=1 Tax=unclassified Streptomyces TaxID=2593676 RepID=UPI00362BBE72
MTPKTYKRQDATGIEARLWDAVVTGDEVRAQAGEEVPAGLIRQLAVGTGLSRKPHRLRLTGARIAGLLDFEAAALLCPLELMDCDLDVVNVEQAQAPAIYLWDCRLTQLSGSQLRTENDLDLTRSRVSGKVFLVGAHIGGHLILDGTHISNPGGRALVADGVRVDQDLRCNESFRAEGTSQMIGAQIDGQFSAIGATFSHGGGPGDHALRATRLTVEEHVVWKEFVADKDVDLQGCVVDGRFDLEKCAIKGHLDMTGSSIGGSLDCSGGHFIHTGKIALDLARAEIKQHVNLRNGFLADGQVMLAGATIGGDLSCEGGQFKHETDSAIFGEALRVGQDVKLSSQYFDGHNVAEHFSAHGQVTLTHAVIGGSLNCIGGRFDNAKLVAIRALGAQVKRSLTFNKDTSVTGRIDLRRACVGELLDGDFTWPVDVHLRRFVYESLYHPGEPSKQDVDKRIKWLRQRPYAPQIYNQLAQVYRSEGRDEYAEEVLVAKEKARRTSRWEKFKGFILRITVRYGYSPLRILIWLGTLEVLGGILFSVFRDDIELRSKDGEEAPFQPWLYTLDLLLPVVTLKQRDLFIPHSTALWLSVGFTISGWILGSVLAVGVVNMIKRPV